jgi:hypothetical protein
MVSRQVVVPASGDRAPWLGGDGGPGPAAMLAVVQVSASRLSLTVEGDGADGAARSRYHQAVAHAVDAGTEARPGEPRHSVPAVVVRPEQCGDGALEELEVEGSSHQVRVGHHPQQVRLASELVRVRHGVRRSCPWYSTRQASHLFPLSLTGIEQRQTAHEQMGEAAMPRAIASPMEMVMLGPAGPDA